MSKRRRIGVHKVGLVASAMGLSSVLALSFGRVRPFRLATGVPLSLFAALPVVLALVLPVLWLVALTASLIRPRTRAATLVRGLAAGVSVIALFWLSGIAATGSLHDGPAFARYSVGAGVWTSTFFAVALILDSRRELGMGSWPSRLVVLLAPLGVLALLLTGQLSSLGMAAEYRNVTPEFWLWAGQHVIYWGVSMTVALVAGVSLGILAYRHDRFARPVFAATSVVQTIPGLAMVGVLAVPLGMAGQVPLLRSLGIGVLGWAPVVIALTLYALLVLVRNTHAGLMSVPESIVDSGRGMGLTDRQLLRKVELPLASPIIFSGTRTAAQQTIGNATLAYFVAAGSLGRPIFSGVSQQANDLVLLGSIALVALALGIDLGLRAVERLVVPRRSGGRA